MKVCFLVGTLARGGAEKQLIFMLRALTNAGIECRVLCLTKEEAYEPEIEEMGVPIAWIGKWENRVFRLINIINNLRKTPADIIQSSHFYTNIYAGIVGRVLNIPSVGAIRSDLDSEIRTHGFFGKWQISTPHFLIANSEGAFRRCINYGVGKDKVTFVRNAVEVNHYEINKRSESEKTIRFLWAGRLDANKKTERFINLASRLNAAFQHQPLQFLIAGDGVRRNELERTTAELNLPPEKVRFLGICADMNKIYHNADVLVSTSEREGTPNVILEAMSHGLPVIAPKIGGIPDILNEECGILVAPDSENDLVHAASRLIRQPRLRRRLGNKGREYVEQNHSLENLEIQLQNIYSKLIGRYRK